MKFLSTQIKILILLVTVDLKLDEINP